MKIMNNDEHHTYKSFEIKQNMSQFFFSSLSFRAAGWSIEY